MQNISDEGLSSQPICTPMEDIMAKKTKKKSKKKS